MLKSLITTAEEIDASDIHLTSGRHATFRVKGQLIKYTNGKIYNKNDLKEIIIGLNLDINDLYKKGSIDTSVSISNSILRLHFYTISGGLALSVRLIPYEIPAFESLNLPEVLKSFVLKKNGLIIVTGATGSGKTTTLASLIQYVNMNFSKKIVTVEDPIEYIYTDDNSLIIQRELGKDVPNFDTAISQAMREDPDILLVGELRDLDTIQSALRMAETGHLVFGTLHTRGAAESFNRIIDVFPASQQDQIRYQLANVTQGVVSQQLILNGKGKMVPLCEVLVMTPGVRGQISSKAHMTAIQDSIQNNHQKLDSQTFIQSAYSLILKGVLTIDDIKDVFSEDDMKKLRNSMTGRNR